LKKIVPSRFKTLVKRMKQDVDNRRTTYTSKVIEFNFRLNFIKMQFNLLQHKISPSHYLITRYEKEGFKGLSYLSHGFPPVPKADLKPSDVLRIGYMGNINYPKGLAVVLKELHGLLLGKRITLHIYGEPYDLQYLNKIKKSMKQLPSDAIKLHGRYKNTFENLWKIFSSFDVLVFPSVWEENAPIVIREALLAGKPVIASKLGGVPEIVKDGINGLLFDPFKDTDLSDKVNNLLDDKGLLKKLHMGVEETKIDSMGIHSDKIYHLYEDVLNKTKLL
jgi:glycosyltransferase involved in cell wall biosynthesis